MQMLHSYILIWCKTLARLWCGWGWARLALRASRPFLLRTQPRLSVSSRRANGLLGNSLGFTKVFPWLWCVSKAEMNIGHQKQVGGVNLPWGRSAGSVPRPWKMEMLQGYFCFPVEQWGRGILPVSRGQKSVSLTYPYFVWPVTITKLRCTLLLLFL